MSNYKYEKPQWLKWVGKKRTHHVNMNNIDCVCIENGKTMFVFPTHNIVADGEYPELLKYFSDIKLEFSDE